MIHVFRSIHPFIHPSIHPLYRMEYDKANRRLQGEGGHNRRRRRSGKQEVEYSPLDCEGKVIIILKVYIFISYFRARR